MTINLSFTEKQDLLCLLSEEMQRLNKELSKLSKTSNKIHIQDKIKMYPELIKRHQNTWNKINTQF